MLKYKIPQIVTLTLKENPIVANRAIYMANPCHIIDKVVPI